MTPGVARMRTAVATFDHQNPRPAEPIDTRRPLCHGSYTSSATFGRQRVGALFQC